MQEIEILPDFFFSTLPIEQGAMQASGKSKYFRRLPAKGFVKAQVERQYKPWISHWEDGTW